MPAAGRARPPRRPARRREAGTIPSPSHRGGHQRRGTPARRAGRRAACRTAARACRRDQIRLADRDHRPPQPEQRRDVDVLAVCGFTPSFAATTSSAASIPVAPAIMVRTNRSWPGMSIRSTARRRPRNVRSRARSKCRAASLPAAGPCPIPVSARTSAVLPWSTCPITPRTSRVIARRRRRQRSRSPRRPRPSARPKRRCHRRRDPRWPARQGAGAAPTRRREPGDGNRDGPARDPLLRQRPTARESLRRDHGPRPTLHPRPRALGRSSPRARSTIRDGECADAGAASASSAASDILSSRTARSSG